MQATRTAIISVFIILCLFVLALITLHLNFGTKVCHEGSFLCIKSEICLPNLYKCNHYKDCLHGEDEDAIQCADLHGSLSIYQEFVKTNRTTLDVSTEKYNKDHSGMANGTKTNPNGSLQKGQVLKEVTTPTPCALRNYPTKCQCRGRFGTALRCNNAGLLKVPRNVSKNLVNMAFVNNTILLTNDSFDEYSNLKVLSLHHNTLTRIPPFVFAHQNQLQWIDLSHNMLSLKNVCLPHLPSLRVMNLQSNRIERLEKCLLANLPSLADLDLSFNAISFIDERAFVNQTRLLELNLTNNHIMTMTPSMFWPLISIEKFSLANNPVKYIHRDVYKFMSDLKSLSLEGIDKGNMDATVFRKLDKLKILYLKEFYYCALYARNVPLCYPNTDDLSSGLNLLPKPILRWTLWLVAFFTLVMNTMVLYGRMFGNLRDENHGINFVIRNLAVADIMMALYLTVIGYHDLKYSDEFFIYAHEWKSSSLCTIIGLIAVVSSEVSLLILVFLSLERFLLIAVPFSGYHVLKLKTATYCVSAIWLVAVCISVTPLLLLKYATKFYGSNGLCYPLYIEDPFLIGWQYSAFVFLGLHSASLLLLSALYTLMFISVWKTRQAARISVGDFEFAVRFFFIVLANALCWLPIIILKFAAIQKFHISSELYGWVVVFVVPINALVNPLLYTFTTPKYRNVLTARNIFKRPNRQSNSGNFEMSQAFQQTSALSKTFRKTMERTNQEISTETTNGD